MGGAWLAAALLLASNAIAQEPPPPPSPTPAPDVTSRAQETPVPPPQAVETPALPAAPGEAEAPAAPPAPETGQGEKIIGIRVVGYQTVSPDTISHYLGVQVGDPYDPAKIQSRFHTLWDVGLLENIAIEAERSPAGVTLIVTIEERPIIKEIEFTGNKKLTDSQIRDRLREQKVELKVGAPLSLRDIARARAAIADYYLEQGFRSATVSYSIEDVSKTEKKVVFTIDEGDKLKIESITFEGNAHVSSQRLRNAMSQTKVATWWRLLSEKTVYSQANYEADVEGIKAVYQSKGYKDIVVKDPKLDVFVVNPQKKPEKQKRRVRITIPLVEGDQFFTNEIRITRVAQSGEPMDPPDPVVLPKQQLLKEFWELPPGAILNRDRLIEALQRIEILYKSRGYIYWFADPVYLEVGDHKVDIDLKMFEGEKFYLGRLEVQGNTNTRDKVIRREFLLNEGDVLDMEAVKKSITRIQQLGYFRMSEEPQFSVRGEDRQVDMIIKGQETSRNEIQFGAGYSGFDGFFGQFSFQTRNFLGRGEVLGASAQIGAVSNYFDLSYTVPWFMDRNQSVGFALFRRKVEYLSIDEQRQGGSVFYGRGLGAFSNATIIYAYEDIVANFPSTGAPVPPGQPPPPAKFTETTGTTSSITPGWRYDSRNDPFDPTRGYRLATGVQFAGSFLGGTNSFLKPILGATAYFPVRFPRGALIGVNLEAGYVAPVSPPPNVPEADQIPIFERFQLGGEQSMRGFAIGAVLPLMENNQVFTDSAGRILGGNKFYVLNVEYAFLRVGPGTLLAFVDVGNNYFDTQAFNPFKVRASAGMELRIFLPIFQAPLRFIYAINLDPVQPIDQFGFPIPSLTEKPSGFQFSIGRTF